MTAPANRYYNIHLFLVTFVCVGLLTEIKWLTKYAPSSVTENPARGDDSFLSSMNLTRDDLFERNYFHRVWMAKGNESSSSPQPPIPVPVDILQRYISQHSHQRLELEWNQACAHKNASKCVLDDRRYLVATYSCPIESGNRLHRYMNGLLWAILTNRTFLWRYETHTVCSEYGEPACDSEYNPHLFRGPSDCHGLLERNPWIPSYDLWREKLDSETLVSATVDTRSAAKTLVHDATTLPYDETDTSAMRWIRSGKQVGLNPGGILTVTPANQTQHLVRPENLERLERLRSKGIYFLYGMLFESLFTMHPSLDPPTELLAASSSPQTKKTLFLHSRHSGTHPHTYIWPEHLCLKQLVPKSNHTNTTTMPPCHVYVLSDQPATVGLLHDEIRTTTDCTSSSIAQRNATTTSSISFSSEHGPRAGRGYWEDLALAIHARDGMISFNMYPRAFGLVRTSTALMREMIEFRRSLEQSGLVSGNPNRSPEGFRECTNPWKQTLTQLIR